MKQTTTTKATATDNKTAFAAMLETYATESKDTTTAAYADALTNLATAVAYSVLKKCIHTSYNPTLVSLRTDIAKAKSDASRQAYASDHAYKNTYNQDGDPVVKVDDPDCAKALADLAHAATIGDGYDLVHDAIAAILEETAKQAEREPEQPTDLERVYTVRRLNRKVWIKSAESVNGWETVETSPIREIYKAVRRAIDTSRAASTDPRNGYTYLEDLATDPESGEQTAIYRRLAKYADLGGYATDFNGATTFYTVDNDTVDRYDDMVAALNLTKKQAQILTLKQSGHGNKAIATYLGVTENSVKGAMNEIKRKARAAFPALTAAQA